MKKSFIIPLLLTVFLCQITLPAKGSAFAIPEKLVFDLTWTGIKAGTATLEIVSDTDSTRIISTARSADWVSVFYTVDDRIESVMTKAQSPSLLGEPRYYKVRIREGRHRRDKEIAFDYRNRKAVAVNHHNGESSEIAIKDRTFDPLSSLYVVRKMDLEVGRSVFVDIVDSKRLWNVEVQVLRKERIRTTFGETDTIVIKPLMKSEGIFNRAGDMYIWLTDDERRLPVRMQTKVAVGKVTATMTGGTY